MRELQKIAKDVRQIKKKVNKIEKKYRNKAAKNFQKKIFPKFSLDFKLKTAFIFFKTARVEGWARKTRKIEFDLLIKSRENRS